MNIGTSIRKSISNIFGKNPEKEGYSGTFSNILAAPPKGREKKVYDPSRKKSKSPNNSNKKFSIFGKKASIRVGEKLINKFNPRIGGKTRKRKTSKRRS